jgi:exodeoxyribonuclease VII large subunit
MAQALDGLSERLMNALPRSLQMRHEKLQRLSAGLSPRLLREMLLRQEQRVQHSASMLESLNVLNVLKRGFALVKDGAGKVVQSAAAMPAQATLSIQFHDGVRSVIAGTDVAPSGGSSAKPKRRPPAPTQQTSLFSD